MFAFARYRAVLATAKSSLSRRSHSSSLVECQQTKSVLLGNGFSENQSEVLLDYLKPYLQKDSPQIICSSLECWRKNLRSKENDNVKNEQRFIDVFMTKEPRLLLVKPEYIFQRMEQIKSLDLVRGKNDLWTLFLKAPSGYYLQDWKEFLRKYYYITYKILPWLQPSVKADALNPLFVCPPVIELSFNIIKTRFLFAQRTGFQASGVTNQSPVNMYTLFLIPVNEFLKIYSPFCSLEEFNALEKLHSYSAGEEDDKLFDDLVELAPKVAPVNNFLNDNLKETYQISDIKH